MTLGDKSTSTETKSYGADAELFLKEVYEFDNLSNGAEYWRPVRKQGRLLISTDPETAMSNRALSTDN